MADFNWVCPHCNHAVTVAPSNVHSGSTDYIARKPSDSRRVLVVFLVCPNPSCGRFTLDAQLRALKPTAIGDTSVIKWESADLLQEWRLVPPSAAKQFPPYIPNPIREDYEEACLIQKLSPKASATLSRRCLQGILRDFWKTKPARLTDEINEIKSKVDPVTWAAIDAVRKIGNIGAHMEKDINVIVDVDPGEAALLCELVETLLTEWYVAKHEREKRMNAVIAAAANK